MGLLTEGSPLTWTETKALSKHVQDHGIEQFIRHFVRLRDRTGDVLKWGDEIEYIIVHFDDERHTAKVALRGADLLVTLNEREAADPDGVKSLWRPEYGAYMIEGTPGQPYGCNLAHFNVVEANMRYRREEVQQLLLPSEAIMSITNFPRSGTPGFTWPMYEPRPADEASIARSLYFPDEAIYPGHPRYRTVTQNVRQRSGRKMEMNLNVFRDRHTVLPIPGSPADQPDVVHLDAMGLGMGCCCLQVTFQACNITEARTLYDQLTPVCPIMLALTAASPAYRGYLVDSDCRWNVLCAAVDCRTPEELGERPLRSDRFRIAKSRCGSTDSYLSPGGARYNDIPLTYDPVHYRRLRDGGVDHQLAEHVAHLFIRDAVSLFSEKVHQDDDVDTDHFENIQSTNWQTMRFKPPPPGSPIGWRVEFRPCEIQLTDFENAAVVCFIVLLTRTILSYGLDFLMPISLVDENMQRAQQRDACGKQRFWFRCNVTEPEAEATVELMTVDEIMGGKRSVGFAGLIPLVQRYLSNMDVDADTHCTIQQYLQLIGDRAAGRLLTAATWIRKEVRTHPDYKHDSIISERINYDLLQKIRRLQTGDRSACPELLGCGSGTKTRDTVPESMQRLLCTNVQCRRESR